MSHYVYNSKAVVFAGPQKRRCATPCGLIIAPTKGVEPGRDERLNESRRDLANGSCSDVFSLSGNNRNATSEDGRRARRARQRTAAVDKKKKTDSLHRLDAMPPHPQFDQPCSSRNRIEKENQRAPKSDLSIHRMAPPGHHCPGPKSTGYAAHGCDGSH
jgi:hypothetical protein